MSEGGGPAWGAKTVKVGKIMRPSLGIGFVLAPHAAGPPRAAASRRGPGRRRRDQKSKSWKQKWTEPSLFWCGGPRRCGRRLGTRKRAQAQACPRAHELSMGRGRAPVARPRSSRHARATGLTGASAGQTGRADGCGGRNRSGNHD